MKLEIKARNMSTELSKGLVVGDKIIRTKDWGDFKIRKNGRVAVIIDDEYIRCTPIEKEEK